MPPKSIKGKERLTIAAPKPKPKGRPRRTVSQIEAPYQAPQLEPPPFVPRLTAPRVKDIKTGTLRGTVLSVISRYYINAKISRTKEAKYEKAVNMIFDEYNFSSSYQFLTNYDVTQRCMTDIDNYLYKHEPILFKKPRIYSKRWEMERGESEYMEEAQSASIPMPSSSSSRAVAIRQSLPVHAATSRHTTSLTSIRDTWKEVFYRGLRQEIDKNKISDEEAQNIFEQLQTLINEMEDRDLRNLTNMRRMYDTVFFNVVPAPRRPQSRYAIKQNPSMELDIKHILGKRQDLPEPLQQPDRYESFPPYSTNKRRRRITGPRYLLESSSAPPEPEEDILEPRKRSSREGVVSRKLNKPVHVSESMANLDYPATATPLNRAKPRGLPPYNGHDIYRHNTTMLLNTPPQTRPHPETYMETQPTPDVRLRIPQEPEYINPKPRPTGHDPIPFRQAHIPEYIPPQPRRRGHDVIPIPEEQKVQNEPLTLQRNPKSEVGIQTNQEYNTPNTYEYEGKLVKPITQEKADELAIKKKTIKTETILNPNRFKRKMYLDRKIILF